jgi:tetratricopeptide (TPR) repeat protein
VHRQNFMTVVTVNGLNRKITMDWIMLVFRRRLSAIFSLLLVGGLAGSLSAAETTDGSGPQLTSPAEAPNRFENANDDTQAVPLANSTPSRERSEQLEQVARLADLRTRHGYELAERNAYFAARSEFLGALRLVAEGLDTEQKTKRHGRALAAAIVALKESEVFLPDGSRLEANLDLPAIIATHETPVLKGNAEGVTPLSALRCYLTFAQEQLAAAVGNEVAGSMALHALGKLHSALAQKKGSPIVAPESKAVVFFQAALLSYPENPLALNDLGVLLARCGRYNEARPILEHSLARFPQSTGWRNLSTVYTQLGQTALAQQAAKQADQLREKELAQRQTSPTAGNGAVQWVNPETFARQSTNPLMTPSAIPTQAVAKPQAVVEQSKNSSTPRAPSSAERMSWGARPYQR